MKNLRTAASNHRVEALAVLGLACLYLAVMSGHLMSIDGLLMWRQALALVYHGSWDLVPPVYWTAVITTSGRGIGASLEYFPGALAFWWLSGLLPVVVGNVTDYKLIYGDILYIVAGAPVWVAVAAASAYLVALTTRALGGEGRTLLWAVAFYGLGSPAFAASRGDTPQPLVALCWILGVYACVRYLNSGGRRWVWIGAAAVCYAVLTRPLEGSILLPGLLLLVATRRRQGWWPLAVVAGGWVLAVVITVLLNKVRFGSFATSGYSTSQLQWTNPIWIGLPGDLISPGRGIIWEFPAIALSVVGAVHLWKRGNRAVALALIGLPTVLLLEASVYVDWVGGWDWGFRFFQPALPLLAVLAGLAVPQLPAALRKWSLPAALLVGGIIWNVPAVVTDVLGGYGANYAALGPGFAGPNFRLDAYPPIGAWRFLHHIFPVKGLDSATVDIVWFRAKRFVGWISLLPFVALLVASAAFWAAALRAARRLPSSNAHS